MAENVYIAIISVLGLILGAILTQFFFSINRWVDQVNKHTKESDENYNKLCIQIENVKSERNLCYERCGNRINEIWNFITNMNEDVETSSKRIAEIKKHVYDSNATFEKQITELRERLIKIET